MNVTIISLWVSVYVSIFFMLLIVLSYKWVKLGIKIFTMKLKGRVGLLFREDISGNIGLPIVFYLHKTEIDIGGDKYVVSKEMVENKRFFGLPYVIFPCNDTKTSLGLYYQQSDKDGNALIGEQKYKDGKNNMVDEVRIVREFKPSVSMPPDVLRAIVTSKALTMAIKELFTKYKNQIYLLLGLVAIMGITGYFVYEIYSQILPNMESRIISKINVVISNINVPTAINQSGVEGVLP